MLTYPDHRLLKERKQLISKHPVLRDNVRTWCGIPPYSLTHSTPRDLSVRFVKIYIIYCLPVYLMPVLLLSNFARPVPELSFSS